MVKNILVHIPSALNRELCKPYYKFCDSKVLWIFLKIKKNPASERFLFLDWCFKNFSSMLSNYKPTKWVCVSHSRPRGRNVPRGHSSQLHLQKWIHFNWVRLKFLSEVRHLGSRGSNMWTRYCMKRIHFTNNFEFELVTHFLIYVY